ncbi:hypothetical protein [Aminobacterium sp. UBA5514]|jgi:hypothetical protein|uniref:hypothetical protein n=1 Tax=Aminobacterium sp. UBA5514 TaxID=1946036 RepID=UPI00257B9ABF|nr:hypothetical protein [Aminobacterium sp. UBA5514]
MNEIERLSAIIDLLVTYHPSGVMVLLGERPPLSDVEWFELAQSIKSEDDIERVDSSVNTDAFFGQIAAGDAIVQFLETLGTWETVVQSARSFRKVFPADWNMFIDHVRYVDNPFSSRLYKESMLARVATKYSVDPKTVTRRRKTVPLAIAREVIGGFQLALFGE